MLEQKLKGFQLINGNGQYPDDLTEIDVRPLDEMLSRRLAQDNPNEWFLKPIYDGEVDSMDSQGEVTLEPETSTEESTEVTL